MAMKYRQPDKEGRYPLSQREYNAILTWLTATDAMMETKRALDDRLTLLRYGKRDAALVAKKVQDLISDLFSTVSTRHLIDIKERLHHTHYSVWQDGIGVKVPGSNEPMRVTPDGFINVVNRAVRNDCFCCWKTAEEAEECPLQKDLASMFPWTLTDQSTDGLCPFAGIMEITKK